MRRTTLLERWCPPIGVAWFRLAGRPRKRSSERHWRRDENVRVLSPGRRDRIAEVTSRRGVRVGSRVLGVVVALATFALCAPVAAQGQGAQPATVVGVTDGDTLRAQLHSGEQVTVGLIGVDAPSLGACGGRDARAGAVVPTARATAPACRPAPTSTAPAAAATAPATSRDPSKSPAPTPTASTATATASAARHSARTDRRQAHSSGASVRAA